MALPWRMSSYRTEHGDEVDLIVETPAAIFAIELKPSAHVGKNNLRGLASFASLAKKPMRSWVLYTGYTRMRLADVERFPGRSACVS